MTTPAFVVEDGTCPAGANSYVSLTDAANIAAYDPILTTLWPQLSAGEQQNLLVYATENLDVRFSWSGHKTNPQSNLRWPRYEVYDRDDVMVGPNVIPWQIKRGTVLLVGLNTQRGNITDDNLAARVRYIRTDGVSLQLQNANQERTQEIPKYLIDLMAGLGVEGRPRNKFVRIRSNRC